METPIHEGDRYKTFFTTHRGTYRYRRIPFSLWKTPATFARAGGIILCEVCWQSFLIFHYDIIVFSASGEQLVKDVEEMLKQHS